MRNFFLWVFILGIVHLNTPLKAVWEILPDEQYYTYKKSAQENLTPEGLKESWVAILDANGQPQLDAYGRPNFGPAETEKGRRWCATAEMFLPEDDSTDRAFSFLLTGLMKGEEEFPFLRACFQTHFNGLAIFLLADRLFEHVVQNTEPIDLRTKQIQFFLDLHNVIRYQIHNPINPDQPREDRFHFAWNPWGIAFRKGRFEEAQRLLEHSICFTGGWGTYECDGQVYKSARVSDMLAETLKESPSALRTQKLEFLIQTAPEIYLSLQHQVPEPCLYPLPDNEAVAAIRRKIAVEFKESQLQNLKTWDLCYTVESMARERERLTNLPIEEYEQGVGTIGTTLEQHPAFLDVLPALKDRVNLSENKWRHHIDFNFNSFTREFSLNSRFEFVDDLFPQNISLQDRQWIEEVLETVSPLSPELMDEDIFALLKRNSEK